MIAKQDLINKIKDYFDKNYKKGVEKEFFDVKVIYYVKNHPS